LTGRTAIDPGYQSGGALPRLAETIADLTARNDLEVFDLKNDPNEPPTSRKTQPRLQI
jgi:hypothetical protein